MRILIAVMLSLLSFNAFAYSRGDRIDFRGHVLSVTQIPCESKDDVIECLYEAWDVRYAIDEVLAGTPVGREITLRIVSHYGLPQFAHYRNAVVHAEYVDEGPDARAWLARDGFSIFRTRAGGWATCGVTHFMYVDNANALPLRKMDYADDIAPVGGFTPMGLELVHRELLGHYDIVDGRVRCRDGADLDAMYAVLSGKRVLSPATTSGFELQEALDDENTPLRLPVRFIGTVRSVERVPDMPCSADTLCLAEHLSEVRLDVVERITTPLPEQVVMRVPNGLGFLSIRQVLVLADHLDWRHMGTRFIPVFRTSAGGWAACGDPQLAHAPKIHPIAFAEDIGEAGQLSDAGVRNAFVEFDGHFDIVDGHVRCREGVELANLIPPDED